jgi:multiple sugar transport system permease protein
MSVATRAPQSPRTPARPPRRAAPRKDPVMPRVAWWGVCSALALLFLYPLYAMVAQSLKAPVEAAAAPPTLFPHEVSLENYTGLATGPINVFDNVANSVFVAVTATVLTVVLSTLGGYAFARLRFPGSNLLFFATLATFMIPFQAIITPLYLVLQRVGLQNSLLGLALVYTTFQLPFGLFLMRNSFAAIPRGLEEAASIDGCSTLRGLFSVMLPVAVPGVVTTALFTFFTSWNEFFAALILITEQDKFTLPVTLTLLSTGVFGSIDWGLLQAGVALTVLPCIAIYVLLQRYYVGGLLSGALK